MNGGREPPELCPDCDRPMIVTGRNVILGGVKVGTTWRCDNPNCFSGYMFGRITKFELLEAVEVSDKWNQHLDDLMILVSQFERRTDDRLYAEIMRSKIREIRSLWYHRNAEHKEAVD